MHRFLIGNILLETDYADVPVLSEGNLQRFRYDGPWQGDRAVLNCTCETLTSYLVEPVVPENRVYGIYTYDGQSLLVYRWGNQWHGFIVWPDRFRVSFAPAMYQQPALREDWFFSICGFHRQLLIREACVLHASYVDIGGEAILFTGPSGIGKSTQAALWASCAGAQIINGDRAVVRKEKDRWCAFGYPSCGTSGICVNRTLPIRAIVVLEQGSNNHIDLVSPAAAIRAITTAMEFYPWDKNEFDLVLDISAQIAAQIPILRLTCTPDKNAVDVLKQYLEGMHTDDSI